MRIDLFRSAAVLLCLALGTSAHAQTTCDSGTLRPYDQAPVSGNPTQVAAFGTTTIETEHFDCGGEGQGYHDNTPGNQSTSTYRNPASVDVMEIATGGRTVQFFDTGEWMAYTLSLGSAGTFNIGIFAASNQVPAGQVAGQFKLQLDGVDITGNASVLSTGSWDSYAWTDAPGNIMLPAGVHTLTLVSVQQSFRVDKLRLVATTAPQACDTGTSRPFSGTPVNGVPVPIASTGTSFLEAERYNCGGEGQGYHDTTPGNQSTSPYRNPDSVDINDQTNGLRTIQFFDTGEWMAYSINVAASGSYTLGISAASGVSGGGGGLYRIEIDGVNVTGSVSVPTTPDWENPQWVDAPTPVSLSAGTHTLRLVSVQQSYRVDRLRIIAGSTGGGSADCGAADLCVSFETVDTQFNTPPPNSTGPHITTTTLGTLVWNVENKGDCSDVNVPACHDRLSLVNFGRDGHSALFIATLDNDLGVQSTTQERSEINIGNAQTDAVPGRVQWWAHSVFFPLDSNIEPQGTSMLQFHPGQDPITCNDCGAPNFILTIQPKTGSDPTMMFRAFTAGTSAAHPTGVDAIHGQYDYFGNGARRSGQCLSTDYQKGVWYDFVIVSSGPTPTTAATRSGCARPARR